MKILQLITKALHYSIFDDFIENGAVRLNEFPKNNIWEEKAQNFYVNNLTLYNGVMGGVWVAGLEDSIVIANWRKEKATKILIRDIYPNPDVLNHKSRMKRFWNKHNRPYLYGSLKVGFGNKGDSYVSEHNDFKNAGKIASSNHQEPFSFDDFL